MTQGDCINDYLNRLFEALKAKQVSFFMSPPSSPTIDVVVAPDIENPHEIFEALKAYMVKPESEQVSARHHKFTLTAIAEIKNSFTAEEHKRLIQVKEPCAAYNYANAFSAPSR